MESGTFTISETQTSSCVSISIVADTVEEPDMECFIVRFSSTASGLTLAPNIATICIHEGILSLQKSYLYLLLIILILQDRGPPSLFCHHWCWRVRHLRHVCSSPGLTDCLRLLISPCLLLHLPPQLLVSKPLTAFGFF